MTISPVDVVIGPPRQEIAACWSLLESSSLMRSGELARVGRTIEPLDRADARAGADRGNGQGGGERDEDDDDDRPERADWPHVAHMRSKT